MLFYVSVVYLTILFVLFDRASPYVRTSPSDDGDRIQYRNRCFLNETRTMDNVQIQSNCINIPSDTVAYLVEALCYKLKGRVSNPEEVIGLFSI
jgi:hypothetical protein